MIERKHSVAVEPNIPQAKTKVLKTVFNIFKVYPQDIGYCCSWPPSEGETNGGALENLYETLHIDM